MKICIIGWYGTETIGDRGILAGIFIYLTEVFYNFEVSIGSLDPKFTKKTVHEDYQLWKLLTHKELNIKIFDSLNLHTLKNEIRNCDILIMGGGPLMHIPSMFMIEYAFKKAKKFKKKTIIFGCGVGPLFYKKYKHSLLNIIRHSDVVIFRDSCSYKNYISIKEHFKVEDKKNIKVAHDPAAECAHRYSLISNEARDQGYLIINLRLFPKTISRIDIIERVHAFIKNIIRKLNELDYYTDVLLLPMHYHLIGGDDRAYLNQIKHECALNNAKVQLEPLNLEESMNKFIGSSLCLGMRFHSALFQTLLNGKNYVLDYTEPQRGKIYGFLNDIKATEIVNNRYINLHDINNNFFNIQPNINRFFPDQKYFDINSKIYIKCLSHIKSTI